MAKTLPLVAGALIATVLAESALAGGPMRPGPVSIETVESRMAERFASADQNGNGEISLEEFTAHEPERRRDGFRGMRPGRDRGDMGPHALSAEEQAQVEAAAFERADLNGDGQIGAEEFTRDNLKQARQGAMKAHMFARLDANEDGVLTADELPSPVERLRAADTDGDGTVSREERRAARDGWRDRG